MIHTTPKKIAALASTFVFSVASAVCSYQALRLVSTLAATDSASQLIQASLISSVAAALTLLAMLAAASGIAVRRSHMPINLPTDPTANLEALRKQLAERTRHQESMESTLCESESRFRAFMDNTPMAAFIKDEQGRYLFGNRRWAMQFGRPPEELLGLTDFDLWPLETARLFRESDAETRRRRQTLEATEAATAADGSQTWMAVLKFPLDGAALLGGIALDITERVRAQQRLSELNQSLERRVLQRTEELERAQSQLVRQAKLSMLGQLAGSVAHEIRNPLGVMRNSVYYLRMTQKQFDEKGLEYLDRIDAEIETANRIIGELLDCACQPQANPRDVPLDELIDAALRQLELPVEIELRRDVLPGVCVHADPGQIERIVVNLLQNAVQAMQNKGTLTLRSLVDSARAGVEVRDSGVGIASEALDLVFEPLYTTKAKGIGLGLSASKTYAELNRGELEVESQLGQGSAFRLWLPRSAGSSTLARGE